MRHNVPIGGRNPPPSFDKPVPPPNPPKAWSVACRADFSSGVAVIGHEEFKVPIEVATEINNLRSAALGSARTIGVVARARDEALNLLAEIIGPTQGPMTLPSVAALEAWAQRARHMLAQRDEECRVPAGCDLLADAMAEED